MSGSSTPLIRRLGSGVSIAVAGALVLVSMPVLALFLASEAEDVEHELMVMGLFGRPVYIEELWREPTEQDRRTLEWLREAEGFAPPRGEGRILAPDLQTGARAPAAGSWRAERAEEIEHALRIREHSALESLGDLPGEVDSGVAALAFPWPGYLAVVETLAKAAVSSALGGEPERAVEELAAAWRAAALLEDKPLLIARLARSRAMGLVLRAWELSLPHLSTRPSVLGLKLQLEAWEPGDEMDVALYGERAFVNSGFRHAHGEPHSEPGEGPFSVRKYFLASDWKGYLAQMRSVMAECSRPRYDFTESVGAETRTVDSRSKVPSASHMHRVVLEDHVRKQLARAALRAHLDGFDAGRALLERQPDPFADAPLQSRVEEDGTLVMWSVGEDGTDEEGRWSAAREDYTDIVWRYHPPKGAPR